MAKFISKSTVDAFAPQAKAAILWDSEIKGFGLRVMPSGVKAYIFQYRMGGRGSPSHRYTIGKHGKFTPDKARKLAKSLAAQVALGINPMAAKREVAATAAQAKVRAAADARQRTELAFAAYVEDKFLTRGLPASLRERTRKGYEGALRNHAVPVLKSKPLPEITRADLQDVFDRIPAGQPSVRRIVHAVLRMLFNFAERREEIAESPLAKFEAPQPVKSRDRVLTDAELALALRAIGDLGAPFGPVYEVLFATGQRREEVAALNWSELDRATATWTLPADRAKNGETHIVPLNRLAVAALDRVAKQDGEARPKWPTRGLVFTTTGETHVSGYSRGKARLDAQMLKLARDDAEKAGEDPEQVSITPWRLHDARRTLATTMQRLGVRFEVTEALLNHRSGASRSGIAAVYQRHQWTDEKREALDRWADHLAGVLEPPADQDAKVVPLRAAKRSAGRKTR